MPQQKFRRAIAYKLKIGDIKAGNPIKENDKLNFVKVDNKEVRRVNIVANIIERFDNPGDKDYTFFTIDDASGQIRLKAFGEEAEKFKNLGQGDTVMAIGKLREYQDKIYVQPEIIKKKDPRYLLVRKLEMRKGQPETSSESSGNKGIKDQIISMIKEAEKEGGISIDKMIIELEAKPEQVKEEIQKLLEEGLAYEPKPGKVRYLG